MSAAAARDDVERNDLARDDIERGRAALARKAKTFSFAALFLSRPVVDDAAVLYAFCREADDAVDDAPDPRTAQQNAEALAAELEGTRAPRPAVRALLRLADRTSLDLVYARALVGGCASDAGPVRLDDDAALLRYAWAVAGTVGGMMCPLLGVTDPRALPAALELGIAMQLTNICRDVKEDAARDRVYLPAARLRAWGVEPDDVVHGAAPREAVAAVVREVLALAEEHYARADAGLRYIPPRQRLAILVAARLYRAIGRRLLARHGGDALHGRTVVPGWWKALRALGAVVELPLLALRPAPAARLQLNE